MPLGNHGGRAKRRPYPAPGQHQRGSGDLPLRSPKGVSTPICGRRLETKSPVYRPGDDRRQHRQTSGRHRGQELSYAEVKAIASGNPAVLTLAETDAELKRLAVLKKHHADEQYTPQEPEELPEKMPGWSGVLPPWPRTGRPSRPIRPTRSPSAVDPARKEAMERLGERLTALPKQWWTTAVSRGRLPRLEVQPVPLCLSHARNLRRGSSVHPAGLPLPRRWPQAVLNAVERTVAAMPRRSQKTTRDLEIAQGQLRDYEARLGGMFAMKRISRT